MIAAPCTGEITIAISGAATPPAPPPIPPLEIPVIRMPGMATIQNQGLVTISKLTAPPSPQHRQDVYAAAFAASSRSTRLRILPVALLGNSPTRSIRSGAL